MARKSTTTSASTSTATVEKSTVAVNVEADEKVTTEEVKNTTKKAIKTQVVEPLTDSEEIEVVNLIPHVSYLDNRNNDEYEWDEVGHVEYMTFETLKNMWRNHKAYFKNMWLKPNDERVIKQFGLTSTYEKYEFLMDESNYTRNNIDKIVAIISDTTTNNGMKFAVCTLVKDSVANGVISDVVVIKTLEKQLNLDLISSL